METSHGLSLFPHRFFVAPVDGSAMIFRDLHKAFE